MGTIIVILIIVQVISFTLIAVLYLAIKNEKEARVEHEKIYDELQQAFTLYMNEIRDENDRFLAEVELLQRERQKKETSTRHQQMLEREEKERKKEKESKKEEQEQEHLLHKHPVLPKSIVATKYKAQVKRDTQEETAPVEQLVEQKEQVEEDEIMMMYERGKTIDEIAKTLNLGKTEVELHIKFRS